MDITPLIAADRQLIQSYGAGRFKISGRVYERAVIVFPDRTEEWNGSDFSILTGRAGDLDVVLYGCGAAMISSAPVLRKKLKEQGIAVDIMPTGAACRTYNVLLAEGRRVAAALLPI